MTPRRMEGRRALITGAADGIGAEIARRFAAEGAAVAVTGRATGRGRGERVADEIRAAGGRADFLVLDVADPDSVEAGVAAARDRLGGLDAVVTAAGVGWHPDQRRPSVVDLADDHWRYVLDVNLVGTFLVARAAARSMVADGVAGTILTVASVSARKPSGGVYAVSKAAVWMLTRVLADELGPHGIRVNAVAPGYTDTKLLRERALATLGPDADEAALADWYRRAGELVPLRRVGQPGDVADAAVLLSGPGGAYLTGSLLHVDGGYASATAGG
ncbi:MAG TPA: SDR family NAD(P)-dependent oxidoreductase [Capillimicrobium sp.]|nr:SDR family NAD(P)-dependent oxidoreductase [Capillimicrobium sp.]